MKAEVNLFMCFLGPISLTYLYTQTKQSFNPVLSWSSEQEAWAHLIYLVSKRAQWIAAPGQCQ